MCVICTITDWEFLSASKLLQSGTSSEVLKAMQGQAEIKHFSKESPDAAGNNAVSVHVSPLVSTPAVLHGLSMRSGSSNQVYEILAQIHK